MSTFNLEHSLFIKKLKREKILINFFRFLIIIVFLLGWEFLARLEIINTFLFSSPSRVLVTLINLFKDGELFKHIGVTLYEVLISFGITGVVGISCAFLLWKYPTLAKIIDPYLTILNSLPKVALGPLIIIWVGASTNSIIFMALTISCFVTIINIYNNFISTDIGYITLMESFRASDLQIFRKVILPSNLQNIVSAMKVNVSMSLIGVIMGELLVSKEGIGYLIMYGSQVFNIDLVITGVFILGVISFIMYYIVNKMELLFK